MSPRVVLQVAVHRDQDLAPGVLDAGRHGRRLAVVAPELHDAKSRVVPGDVDGKLKGAVTAAVIDEHHLERDAQWLDRLDDGRVHAPDVVLLVVEGNDDGDRGMIRHAVRVVAWGRHHSVTRKAKLRRN